MSPAPRPSEAIVSGSAQPRVSALENPYTRPNSPAVTVTTPGRSMRARSGLASLTSRITALTAAGIANSRLTYRHQRHDSTSVRMPPSSRPIAAPPPAIAPKIPNALPRSSGSVNVVVSNDNAEGASSAPNAPCSARAATKTPKDCAAPPSADAIANPSKPTTNVHLRPNRSEMRPPSSRRLPNASAYAVTIHWRFSLENPRSSCADGNAMFTIVASRTTINCAIPSIARIAHRRS